MVRISIYDMDKTITRKATFGPFIAHALPRGSIWRVLFLPVMAATSIAYLLRLIDRGQLKAANLKLLMGHPIDTFRLDRMATSFSGHSFKTNMLQPALDQIAQDKAEGRMIVIASASYAFYVQEIARLCGIDHVIATKMTVIGPDQVDARIDGANCYGLVKLDMVRDWLAEQGIDREEAHIRFYSDHVSDQPCFDWADEAIVTNPHAPLRTLAERRGWPIKDWA